MDPRLQRRVQRYGWDKASAEYERYWRQQLEPAQTRVLALAALQSGERVLDVACGTGLVTFPAARLVGAAGRVVGTDLSQEMITRAAEDARAQGLAHATFARMDAEALDVEPGSFDVALCSLGLMYVPDPAKALAEMRRALRPGGRAIVAVWGAQKQCGWAEIFPIVDRRVASEVCPMFFQLGMGDQLRRAFESAGFVDPRIERLPTLLHYDSDADACGAAFAGGPVALAYSRFDEQAREDAHGEYLGSIKSFRAGTHYDVPGEFVIGRATAPSIA